MDSSERVLEASSTVKGAARDASLNACTALEDEVPVEKFPCVDNASVET